MRQNRTKRDLHDIEVALSRLDAVRRDLMLGKPDDVLAARMALSAATQDLEAVRDRMRDRQLMPARERAGELA